jgi:hypothetical protein
VRGTDPIIFNFEIEVVTGEEGKRLRLEQARAIREFLKWLREHRNHVSMAPSDQTRALLEEGPRT